MLAREDAISQFKSELAVTELEIQVISINSFTFSSLVNNVYFNRIFWLNILCNFVSLSLLIISHVNNLEITTTLQDFTRTCILIIEVLESHILAMISPYREPVNQIRFFGTSVLSLFVVLPSLQALLNMAKEIASYGIPAGSRKVNGKYIQSLLLLQLQGMMITLQVCP